MGVSIFFIISGFIITKHALREYAETGGFSTEATQPFKPSGGEL